ncbi:hypothetical protein [Bradyrhizobium japonicum]|nr:hypothetical protein [Bradyrhizobium japonicum]
MRTAVDADRNAQSGYIAEDEQTKPEMLTQPVTPAHFFRFAIRGEEHRSDRRAQASGDTRWSRSCWSNCYPPPTASGVIVLFAAMPTRANAYILAVQYQRLVNPVSGGVALGMLLAALTLPVVLVAGGQVVRQRPDARSCGAIIPSGTAGKFR